MKIATTLATHSAPPTPAGRAGARPADASVDAYGPSRPEIEGIYKPSQLAHLFASA